GMPHSAWELLEHMRLAQEDILEYTLDPKWVSPPFPEGYWPDSSKRVPAKAWSDSVARFLADLRRVIQLVRDPRIDVTAKIPHGEGRTYLRQALLVADHNAYHLGQIVDLRKALGDWDKRDAGSI
ncbi:MAG TPA: DinB family protein, partial [Blastocatellia bacterium]|nr:DinB family protein [Blastocatellia bacterium]